MANMLYNKAREAFLKGEINWVTDTIKAVLVDIETVGHKYDVDAANHQYLAIIPAEARIATATLTGKTATDGIADASDTVFGNVAGNRCGALVLFKDTGNVATSPLIAYLDAGLGLPVTPNGENINIQWGDTYNKIFRL
jgi:hypothetical protein